MPPADRRPGARPECGPPKPPPRFIPVSDLAVIGVEPSDGTRWWYDTARPFEDGEQPFMAVQTYADKDANDFRPVTGEMCLLFTDQAEYYAVCPDCYSGFRRMQWSGSTRGPDDWRERAASFIEKHERTKGWCEFCDPVFGNGGWKDD